MSVDAMESWSIRELKVECTKQGASCDHCTEKSELVELVARLQASNASRQSRSGAPSTTQRHDIQNDKQDGAESEKVRRVLALPANDFYGILTVNRNADAEEIKKAYRVLALSLHPDKCPARGADEAFKRVGAAFAVLRDRRKRAEYDLGGDADGFAGVGGFGGGGHSTHPSGHRSASSFRDQDAEELFRAFFGSDGPGLWGSSSTSHAHDGSALTPARTILARASNLVALSQRLIATFTRNPWTLITLLSGLASLASILESLIDMLGGFVLALLPCMAVAGYVCPPVYRAKVGILVALVLLSGIF